MANQAYQNGQDTDSLIPLIFIFMLFAHYFCVVNNNSACAAFGSETVSKSIVPVKITLSRYLDGESPSLGLLSDNDAMMMMMMMMMNYATLFDKYNHKIMCALL